MFNGVPTITTIGLAPASSISPPRKSRSACASERPRSRSRIPGKPAAPGRGRTLPARVSTTVRPLRRARSGSGDSSARRREMSSAQVAFHVLRAAEPDLLRNISLQGRRQPCKAVAPKTAGRRDHRAMKIKNSRVFHRRRQTPPASPTLSIACRVRGFCPGQQLGLIPLGTSADVGRLRGVAAMDVGGQQPRPNLYHENRSAELVVSVDHPAGGFQSPRRFAVITGI
jgi:hypothetical protein